MKRLYRKTHRRHKAAQAGFTISAAQQWRSRFTARRQNPDAARPHVRSDGFTIIELMIATLVFSVVLLIITYGVIHFTNSYYKGINSSTTQTTAQNAIDTISQAIQFSSANPTTTDGTEGFFCAGSKLFLYQAGVAYKGDPTATTGLYMMNAPTGNCASASPSGGTELLGKNMRVASISVSNPNGHLWHITLTIAYGDADLLCNLDAGDSTQGSCAKSAAPYNPTDSVIGADVSCKSQIGSQFCSVVGLTTSAVQRLAND